MSLARAGTSASRPEDNGHLLHVSAPTLSRYERSNAPNAQSNVPPARVMLLFSGGLDSTVLAAMAHRSLPCGEPIDLVTVCFDAGRSPDRLASLDALQELSQLAPERDWRLLLVDATLADVDAQRTRCAAACMSPTVLTLCAGTVRWRLHDTSLLQ